MKFKTISWPNNQPETTEIIALRMAHAGILAAVADFDEAASAISQNRKYSPVEKSVEIDDAKQTAHVELDRITREDLRHLAEDFKRERAETKRHAVPSESAERRYREIRAVLRDLPVTKRKAALDEALTMRDLLLIEAIQGGSPLLCGMTGPEYAAFVERTREALYGEFLRTLDQCEEILTQLQEQLTQAKKYIDSYEIEGEYASAV